MPSTNIASGLRLGILSFMDFMERVRQKVKLPKYNLASFSLGEALMPLVVIGLVGSVGWYSYQHRQMASVPSPHTIIPGAGVGPQAHSPAPGTKPPTPSPSPPNSPGSPASSLKPPIRGLIDVFKPPPAAYRPVVQAYVVNAHWSDLQPTPGGPLATNNAIDQAITQVRQLNAQDPAHPLALKLRLFAGQFAPDWAKNLGGPPFTVTDTNDHASATVGRFWLDEFGQAYQDLQTKLAAKYDAVPEIREVVTARCMTIYAEPLVRHSSDPTNVQNFLAAGYSVAADHACQTQQIDAMKGWQTTRVDLAFNPYQVINADGSTKTDESFTGSLMDYCRATLASQCVLENNSIRNTSKASNDSPYAQMYAKIKTMGPPITFQTAATGRVGDLLTTLQFAIDEGASSVEVENGYKTIDVAALAPYDAKLINQ